MFNLIGFLVCASVPIYFFVKYVIKYKIKGGEGVSIVSNLVDIVRGSLSEAGENAVKENKITLFEQKIRDAEDSLSQLNGSITEIMATKNKEQRLVDAISGELKSNDEIIKSCLKKDRKDLASEVAEEVIKLEEEQKIRQGNINKLEIAENAIKKQSEEIWDKIEAMKSQSSLLKANESVNKALRKTSEIIGKNAITEDSSLSELGKKIEEDQLFEFDKIKAAEQMWKEKNPESLMDKLEKEGITKRNQSVDDILKRYE